MIKYIQPTDMIFSLQLCYFSISRKINIISLVMSVVIMRKQQQRVESTTHQQLA